jgi:IS1 family transposase/transposase-like protein
VHRKSSVTNRSYPNPECEFHGQSKKQNIIKYGYFKLKKGRRRRYLCKACKKVFCSNTSTPYYRIHYSRNLFDEVCMLSVEGVNKSAISRIKHLSWNTVSRWLECACIAAKRFNRGVLKGFTLREPQADEIRTFIKTKSQSVWIITLIDVWSRLWPSYIVGKRNYKNVRRLFQDTIVKSERDVEPLITTDGFKPYARVIKRLFGCSCVYGQVIKTRRKDRVVSVDRKLIIGSQQRLDNALERSEDSSTLNTSFVERHNLTIRRGSAYLHRLTPSHAKRPEYLKDHLELLQCHYNFIRPHSALKYDTEIWTPAMQAGLVKKQLSFREIFTRMAILFWWISMSLRNRTQVKELSWLPAQ